MANNDVHGNHKLTGKRIGLVLGSGGPRGSAHVGVLKVLEKNGIRPDIIVGASMGAEIGGAYAAGVPIPRMEAVWHSINFGTMIRALFPSFPWSGWTSGKRVLRMIRDLVGDVRIENLPITFAAVTTDLATGLPYVIREGPLAVAIRASESIPGLFSPVEIDGHLLIDGGTVDPVPVDVARQLGADVVIAVDVLVRPTEAKLAGITLPAVRERSFGVTKAVSRSEGAVGRRFHPHVISVLLKVSTIFQKRLATVTLAAYPPDVLIEPDFSKDPPCYHGVRRGIEAGVIAAEQALPRIRAAIAAE